MCHGWIGPRCADCWIPAFGAGAAPRAFQSPGRVDLIGDHIDYSGGSVLPMALDRGTYLLVPVNGTGLVRGISLGYLDDGIKEVSLDDTARRADMGWFAYVAGVVEELAATGPGLQLGLDIALAGDIPDGSGLSSSSSLELGIAVAANVIGDLGLTETELALVGQRARTTTSAWPPGSWTNWPSRTDAWTARC